MKNMKKAFILIATLFALLPVLTINAFAATDYHDSSPIDYSKSGIYDGYDFFTEDEEAELTRLVQDKAAKLDMNIFIFIAGYQNYKPDDYATECFADDSYDERFGEDTDGVFYFMDFTGKQPAYDYISTSGTAVLQYQDHIDSIINKLTGVLPPSGKSDYKPYKNNVTEAINIFLSELERYAASAPSGYYHDESSGKYFYYEKGGLVITKSPPLRVRLRMLVIAIPSGLLTTLIFYFVTKSKYKFKMSASPSNYVQREKTFFSVRSDVLTGSHTTKTKIQSGSSGGSHGGGHSHSGGHGGGGGHR